MKKTKIKKYIIYSPRRTGSTLIAKILEFYYRELRNSGLLKGKNIPRKIISWEGQVTSFNTYDDFSIYHTHDIDFFSNAPDKFVKILSTRSILDSVLSLLLALETNVWHFDDQISKVDYVERYQNKQFYLRAEDFRHHVIEYDQLFCRANQVIKNSKNSMVLSYHNHVLDLKNLYQCLEIQDPFKGMLYRNLDISSGGTRCLNKLSLISNLQNLSIIYQNLNVINNYNDHLTLQNIQKFIKK